jgi:6-phosphogluconolactonase
MSIDVLDGADTVADAAAEAFVDAAARAIAARGRFTVALAGGSTPKATYERLAARPERVDWRHVVIFFGDERCVPPDHKDSNYRMAWEALLAHVPIDRGEANVHRMRGELPPVEAAQKYDPLIARAEPIDLVLLGMGPDGHTASLFPGTTALAPPAGAHVVAVHVPKLDAWRVTLTAAALSAAREVLITTVGTEKAEALALALEGPPSSVPIQLVQPAGGPRWIIDRAAASRLRSVVG